MATLKERYTAEAVKAMADARGLKAEIVQIRGMFVVQPVATVEALGLVRDWKYYYPHDYAAQAGRK